MKKYLWLLILLLFISQFNAGGKAEHGSAVRFDGDDDYMITLNAMEISGAEDRTITFRTMIKDLPGANQALLNWGVRTASQLFGMYVDSDSNLIFWGYTNDYDTGINADTNDWHSYVATYSGTHVRTYYDGLETPTSNRAKTLNTTNTNLVIAASVVTYGAPMAVIFDEVRLYARVFDSTEVAWGHRHPEGIYNSDSLELWLGFNEFTGDTTYDKTEQDKDGILKNGAFWTIQTPVIAGKEK